MTGWRFYPLDGFLGDGVLTDPNGTPVVASFWTPQEARAAARAARPIKRKKV